MELADQLDGVRQKILAEPRDAFLRYRAGKLYREMGQGKEALVWFETALWINPDHQATHLSLADYYTKRRQLEQAAYHLRRAEGK
jgi:tetratricopeptide (TPR) repeat protein